MARVVWSARALNKLAAIGEFIALDSPTAAEVMVRRIYDATDQLADFPASGRIVPDFRDQAVRELIIGNYRVIYRVMGDVVNVLTVQHGAQQLSVSDIY